MPSITLKCPFKQNKRVFSSTELLELYFYGIKLVSQDGKVISDQMFAFYIDSATEEMEKALDIKITPQIIEEQFDFQIDDWRSWGYARVTYPARKVYSLNGFIGDTKQIEYPKELQKLKNILVFLFLSFIFR